MTVPTQAEKSFANCVIVSASSARKIAADLGKEIGARVLRGFPARYPDETLYVDVPDLLVVEGRPVIVVGDTQKDEDLIELAFLQSELREAKAARITTVLPHYAYARQDRALEPGRVVGARAVADMLWNTDDMIVVDPHKMSVLGHFDVETRAASCVREISEYLYREEIDLVLAPDIGALPRAKEIAEFLGVKFNHFEKIRVSASEVEVKLKQLDIPGVGARVALVDDIISTGATMIAAAEEAKRQASYVIAVCTHGLFVGDALQRLKAVCDEVVSTDTIPSEAAKISSVPAIVRALKAMP